MNKQSFIGPYNNQLSIGQLSTPITDSGLTSTLLMQLAIYRPRLSDIFRGLEIGMVHGYFIIGPFYILGPLRNFDIAASFGYLSTIGLIIILTSALSLYGEVLYSNNSIFKNIMFYISHTYRKKAEKWFNFNRHYRFNKNREYLRYYVRIAEFAEPFKNLENTTSNLASKRYELPILPMISEKKATQFTSSLFFPSYGKLFLTNDSLETFDNIFPNQDSWNEFTGGFFIGALGGSGFAFLILNQIS